MNANRKFALGYHRNNWRIYWCAGAALGLHAAVMASLFLWGQMNSPTEQRVEVFLIQSAAQIPAPSLTQTSKAKAARARPSEQASPFVRVAHAPNSSVPEKSAERAPRPVRNVTETPEDAEVGALNSAAGAPPAELPRRDPNYVDNQVGTYPAMSKRLGEQGTVLLRVYVKPDGAVADVVVMRSSGYARLDNDARRIVERWRYLPARNGDTAVGAWARPIAYKYEFRDG